MMICTNLMFLSCSNVQQTVVMDRPRASTHLVIVLTSTSCLKSKLKSHLETRC